MKLWNFFGFITLLIIISTSVWAQSVCLPHNEAVERLKNQYNERRAWVGIQHEPHSLVEVFVNPKDSTWTILITRSTGISCVTASGNAYFFENPSNPGLPASSN